MAVARESINRIVEMREILPSFQTGFNLVNAAVVCAILASISGLEPSSDITEAKDLKLVTVSNFSLFTLSCVEKDSKDSLVNLDNTDTDVFLYGCPQSCTPNPAEGLLEVYGDMTEVLLVLEMFLTNES